MNSLYVVSDDISTPYRRSLDQVVNSSEGYLFGLVTKISKPILDNIDEEVDTITSEVEVRKNHYLLKTYKLEGLNIDTKIHQNFKEFHLYTKKGRKWLGKDKIADRIYALEEGVYHRDLDKSLKGNKKQLDYLVEHLVDGKVKGWHNALVCIVFDPKRDLCYPKAPCLMSIDFKPEDNKLHIIADWRSQYFNTKAYGNFISLARLLRRVCKDRGFQPGSLISIAHKAILEHGVQDRLLLEKLKEI